MKAAETVEGLHGAKGKPKEEDRKWSNQDFTMVKQKCDICHKSHAIKKCERYKAMSLDDNGKLQRKRICVFVVWLITTKERTLGERKNVV